MALTLSLTPLAPARSEHDLVAATRDGDDHAFAELYSRYRERIASFVVSKVHDHARAEDIAQEVFISALRRLRATDQPIVFKPWIYEIAKNACIDEFRRTRRAREVSLDADEESGGDRRALLSLAPSPPAAIESKQSLDDLQGAFGVLSENHHKLLVMRELEGLSYTEIGARTGMSRQMVESTLFRARRKLTEEYDEIASGRRCQQVQALIEEGRAQSARACGVRQRRQLTRHLAYCQACRRKARLAGVDESFVKPRSIAAKIGALLPFPLWRWPWGGAKAAKRSSRSLTKAGSAKSAAGAAGSVAPGLSLGPAALTAAALAVAGVGAGAVAGLGSAKHPTRPAITARPASSTRASGSPARMSRTGLTRSAPAVGGAVAGARAASPKARPLSHPRRVKRAGGGGGSTPGRSTNVSGPPGSGGAGGSTTSKSNQTTHSPISSLTGTAKSTVSGVTSVAGKTVDKVGSTVGGVTSKAGSTVKGVTTKAGSTISGVTSKAGSTVSGVTSKAGSTVSGVTSKAGSTVSGVTSKAGSTVSGVTGGAGSAVGGAAGSATSSAGSAIGGTASKAGSTLGGAASTAGSSAGSAVSKTGSALGGATSKAGSAVGGATSALGDAASGATKGLTGGLG